MDKDTNINAKPPSPGPAGSGRLGHMDRDTQALLRCCNALDRCTSPRMVKATLAFLVDKYITPPNETGQARREEPRT